MNSRLSECWISELMFLPAARGTLPILYLQEMYILHPPQSFTLHVHISVILLQTYRVGGSERLPCYQAIKTSEVISAMLVVVKDPTSSYRQANGKLALKHRPIKANVASYLDFQSSLQSRSLQSVGQTPVCSLVQRIRGLCGRPITDFNGESARSHWLVPPQQEVKSVPMKMCRESLKSFGTEFNVSMRTCYPTNIVHFLPLLGARCHMQVS